MSEGSFVRFSYHQDEMNRAWWRGFIVALATAVCAVCFGMLLRLWVPPAQAQTVPPTPSAPTSYTFTFKPEEADALYIALERASQIQQIAIGERSPRWDALEQKILMDVGQQKAAAAAAAKEKPKDVGPGAAMQGKPKDEAKP